MKDEIVYNEDKDEYYIFCAVEDFYYNHIAINNILYCPKCGRKLK